MLLLLMLLLKLKYLQNQKLNINKFIVNFVEMDLIASEFKLHKEPKMLTTLPDVILLVILVN